MRLTRSRLLVLFGMFISSFAWNVAGSVATIKLDIESNTLDPAGPIVNVAAADAIQLVLIKDGTPISDRDYKIETMLIAGAVFEVKDGVPTPASSDIVFAGNHVVINTKRCGWKESSRDRKGKAGCPSTILSGELVTLHAENAAISLVVKVVEGISSGTGVSLASDRGPIAITAAEVATAKASNKAVFSRSITIELVAQGSKLFWSGGLTWFDGIRDERFILRPITEDPESVTLVQVSDGSAEYKIAANAHYRFSQTRSFHRLFSGIVGLSTDIPVNDLSAYAGLAFSPPVWPFDEGGHVYIGYGYSKAARLAPAFEGLSTVPASTKLEDVTQDEYDYGLVFGFSFTFMGGKDQFKALLPGGTADSGTK